MFDNLNKVLEQRESLQEDHENLMDILDTDEDNFIEALDEAGEFDDDLDEGFSDDTDVDDDLDDNDEFVIDEEEGF